MGIFGPHFDSAVEVDSELLARMQGLHGADAGRRLQPHPRSGAPLASLGVHSVEF
jgi:hypothetical protein